MQLMFGKYYKIDYALEMSKDDVRQDMVARAMRSKGRRINSKTPLADNRDRAVEISKVNESDDESKKKLAICLHIQKLCDRKRDRPMLKPKTDGKVSYWTLLRNIRAKLYFHEENIRLKKRRVLLRFVRIVKLVINIRAFVDILFEDHLSMRLKLSEPPILIYDSKAEKNEMNKSAEPVTKGTVIKFDPHLYKNSQAKNTSLPLDVVMIMTKSWFTRSSEEIGETVKCLYPYLLYHKYPMNVQMQMANTAWYTRVRKGSPIVREGNAATKFYILISGQVVITELVENSTDHKGHENSKFVKYLNGGERFGDEEMDRFERKRSYNAYTSYTSELLAIDYAEYQHCLLESYLRFNSAPSHITFILKLPLLSSLTEKELLRAAKAGHIELFYFVRNTVITNSLLKSDFIFIVVQGQCHTAVRKTRCSTRSTHSQINRESYRATETEPSRQPKVEETDDEMRDVITCKFMGKNNTMMDEFIEKIGQITASSSQHSKSETAKQIKRIRILKLVGSVYGRDTAKKISDELAERIHMHESMTHQYQLEIDQMKEKTEKVKEKLAIAKKYVHAESNLKQLIEKSDLSFNHTSFRSKLNVSAQTRSPTPQQSDARKAETALLSPKKAVSKTVRAALPVVGTSPTRSSQETPPISPQSQHRVNANTPLKTQILEESYDERKDSSSVRQSYISSLSSNSSTGTLRPNITSHSDSRVESQHHLGHVDDPSPSSFSFSSLPKPSKVTFEKLPTPSGKATDPSRKASSYGAALSVCQKGDIIGNEYVDYNDGRYRCPEIDSGLISDGSELVLVSKKFLLDKFFKLHRRFDLLKTAESAESVLSIRI